MIRPWKYLHNEQLKLLRFKDLELDLEESHLWDWLCDFQDEIDDLGLNLAPHYSIGTEWFVADGSLGIAIPYYLLHPKLTELHEEMLGTNAIEGKGKKEFFKYLRHELGHVVDNAFHLRKLKSRQNLFGKSSKPYPKSYIPNPYDDSYVQHISGHYAQAHPDEDWAETFAVWMTYKKSTWKRKYTGKKAIKKLEFVDQTMTPLLGKRPRFGKRTCAYSVEFSPLVLEEFFRIERKRIGGRLRPYFVESCTEIFSEDKTKGAVPAEKIIKKHEKVITKRIQRNLGRKSIEAERLLEDLIQSSQDLYLTANESTAKNKLLAMIDGQGHDFYKKGFHRILM